MPCFSASSPAMPCSAAYLVSVVFILDPGLDWQGFAVKPLEEAAFAFIFRQVGGPARPAPCAARRRTSARPCGSVPRRLLGYALFGSVFGFGGFHLVLRSFSISALHCSRTVCSIFR